MLFNNLNNNYSETTSKSDGWIQVHKEHLFVLLNIRIQKQREPQTLVILEVTAKCYKQVFYVT